MQQQALQQHLDALAVVSNAARGEDLAASAAGIRAVHSDVTSHSERLSASARPRLLKALSKAAGHALQLIITTTTSSGSASPAAGVQLKSSTEVVLLTCLAKLIEPWTQSLPHSFADETAVAANKVLHEALATTSFMRQLACAATVVAAQMNALSDPASYNEKSLLAAATLGRMMLHVWNLIIQHDTQEDGNAIAKPQYAATVPQLAALGRALLCSIPADSSAKTRPVWAQCASEGMMLGHNLVGSIHMQYCSVMVDGEANPPAGTPLPVAHALARNEDVQVVLLAFLAAKVAHAHQATKGGTQLSSAMDAIGLNFPFRATPCPTYHNRLYEAQHMPGVPQLLDKVIAEGYMPRKLSRLAIWTVEHQWWQREPGSQAPLTGRVGVPCGAHGAVLALLSEYMAVVGPESIQVRCSLRMCTRVAADWAEKLAAGSLPEAAAAPAATAGGAADAAAASSSGTSSIREGLAAVLEVAIATCMGPAAKKCVSPIAEMPEPEGMFVYSHSEGTWSASLLSGMWSVLGSLLEAPEGAEQLAPALWQQPTLACASLEWLLRYGSFDAPTALVTQPTAATRIRLIRRIAAACAALPEVVAASANAGAVRKAALKAEGDVASLLITCLKHLKLSTASPQQNACPPAAWRAIAELAGAAAALGSWSADNSSAADATGIISAGAGGVRKGRVLWASTSGYVLAWLGPKLQLALSDSSSMLSWGDGAPEQLLAVMTALAGCITWLAAALPPSLTGPDGMAAPSSDSAEADWRQLQLALGTSGTLGAVFAAISGLRELLGEAEGSASRGAAMSPSALVQHLQTLLAPACTGVEGLGQTLVLQLPSTVCCNSSVCSSLAAHRERDAASGKGTRCSGCKSSRFCQPACQKLAWRAGHKEVCKRLAAAAAPPAASPA